MANEVKVPCGGFKLGGGLNLNGDVVESNVKIYTVHFGGEQIGSSTWRYFFAEDSQIQSYEQLFELYKADGYMGRILLVDEVLGLFYDVSRNGDLSYTLTLQSYTIHSDNVGFQQRNYTVKTDSTIEFSQNAFALSKQ